MQEEQTLHVGSRTQETLGHRRTLPDIPQNQLCCGKVYHKINYAVERDKLAGIAGDRPQPSRQID
jgi:hypothetical protein